MDGNAKLEIYLQSLEDNSRYVFDEFNRSLSYIRAFFKCRITYFLNAREPAYY